MGKMILEKWYMVDSLKKMGKSYSNLANCEDVEIQYIILRVQMTIRSMNL